VSTRGKHTSLPNGGGQAAPSLCLSSLQHLLKWRARSRRSASKLQQVQRRKQKNQNEGQKLSNHSQPKSGNNSKVPPANEWVNKMWYILIMNSILFEKSNEISIHVQRGEP